MGINNQICRKIRESLTSYCRKIRESPIR